MSASPAPQGRAGPGGAEQQVLDGMPVRLYSCTPSRLTTWLDCPRRYRMAYLDRPAPAKGPPWAHNSLGASVHTALAAWWRLPVKQRTPARAGALVHAGWLDDGFRDAEQSAARREDAVAMVERYVATLDPTQEPIGVERTVGTRTATLALSGRVDRLDLRDGGDDGDELVVVDYKTGRHVPTTDDVRGSLALALYAVASASVLRRPCRRVELHHLPSGQVVAWEHTPESLARHVRRAEAIGREAAAADAAHRAAGEPAATMANRFPTRTGPGCGWCDYAQHCPEGRAAAARREPWAGVV